MKETQIYDADELAERWEYLYAKKTIKDIKKRLEVDYKRGNWHALHIALWTWLSLNGEREKEEWFKKFDVPEVISYCFACEAAKKCVNCPMERNCFGWCANGLFIDWRSTTDKTKRAELARKIAEMEWEERL